MHTEPKNHLITVTGPDGKRAVAAVSYELAQLLQRVCERVNEEPHGQLPPDRIAARQKTGAAAEKRAESLLEQFKKLADLDVRRMVALLGLVDLMAFDDSLNEGSNWTLAVIEHILWPVVYEGLPAAHEQSPADIVEVIAGEHNSFMWNIEDAQKWHKRHPRLVATAAESTDTEEA